MIDVTYGIIKIFCFVSIDKQHTWQQPTKCLILEYYSLQLEFCTDFMGSNIIAQVAQLQLSPLCSKRENTFNPANRGRTSSNIKFCINIWSISFPQTNPKVFRNRESL